MTCSLCGQEILEAEQRTCYRQVVGWIRGRKAGGVNALADRKETGAFAHFHCVEAVKTGRSVNQQSLFS